MMLSIQLWPWEQLNHTVKNEAVSYKIILELRKTSTKSKLEDEKDLT